MRFVTLAEASEHFRGKRVALIGSGPSVLNNAPGFIDSHDVVVRVNNHKLGPAQGYRTDVHYSFYGNSIRKTPAELQREGVRLVMCKCPDAQPIESEWHKRRGKMEGVDFTYIYRLRKDFWFCDTFVPTVEHFLESFNLLERHIPTTGFAAILDVLACKPARLFLSGYDMFTSGIHNVDEKWKPGDPSDPIGHRPDLEAAWLAANAHRYLLTLDPVLSRMLNERRAA